MYSKVISVLALFSFVAPTLAATGKKNLRRDGGICHRLLEAIREDQPHFDPVAECMYTPTDNNGNGYPDRYTGCWFDGTFQEDVSGEDVDEFCECFLAYEYGCMGKIPFGELPGPASNQQPVQWSQLVTGKNMSPDNFAAYCEFAGVWTGDFDVDIDKDMEACGCLWIDMVEEFIDECPGIEYVAP